MDFSLSPVSLFHQAGTVGKGVMLLLLVGSIWSWVTVGEIWLALRAGQHSISRLKGLQDVTSLTEAAARAVRVDVANETGGERCNRVGRAMVAEQSVCLQGAVRGLSFLSVVASVSPFVGLLGTVWGVVTAFAGIAQAQEASLATVAPGVAEALAATAFGLAVAIPAAFFYTVLNARLTAVEHGLAEAAANAATEICAASLPLAHAVETPHAT